MELNSLDAQSCLCVFFSESSSSRFYAQCNMNEEIKTMAKAMQGEDVDKKTMDDKDYGEDDKL